MSDTDRTTEALASYLEARAIFERLVHDEPTVAEYLNDLAASHNNIGLLLSDLDRTAEALESHQKAVAIRERLTRDHPTVAEYQNDLARSFNNIGSLRSETGHPAEALRVAPAGAGDLGTAGAGESQDYPASK